MKSRWTIKTTVPESHKLQIEVPSHIPPGPATLAVEVISEEGRSPYVTGEELLASEIVYGLPNLAGPRLTGRRGACMDFYASPVTEARLGEVSAANEAGNPVILLKRPSRYLYG